MVKFKNMRNESEKHNQLFSLTKAKTEARAKEQILTEYQAEANISVALVIIWKYYSFE